MIQSQKHKPPLWLSALVFTTISAIGLWVGFGVGNQESQLNRMEADRLATDDLLQHAYTFAQSLSDTLEQINLRSQSLTAHSELKREDPIMHWTRLKIENGQTKEITAIVHNPSWKKFTSTEEFHYIRSIIGKLDFTQRRLLRYGDHLCLASPDSEAGVFHLILIDPVKAFQIFSNPPSAANRAYLLGQDGKVLAHTQPVYVGMSFDQTPVFRKVFTGSKNGHTEAIATDQTPVRSAYYRVWEDSPFAVVYERPLASQPSTVPLRAEAILAGVLVFVLLTSAWLSRDFYTRPASIAEKLQALPGKKLTLHFDSSRHWIIDPNGKAGLELDAEVLKDIRASQAKGIVPTLSHPQFLEFLDKHYSIETPQAWVLGSPDVAMNVFVCETSALEDPVVKEKTMDLVRSTQPWSQPG